MARPQLNAAELKQQLIAELEAARAGLAQETRLAQEHLSPAALMQRSVAKHKVTWMIGGVVAGLVIVRLLMPSHFRSDKSGGSDRKRGFSGFVRGALFTMAQRAAMKYAKDHLQDHVRTYLDSFLNRQGPDRSSHVSNS